MGYTNDSGGEYVSSNHGTTEAVEGLAEAEAASIDGSASVREDLRCAGVRSDAV